MSKRRATNLLKRKLLSVLKKTIFYGEVSGNDWAKKQLHDLSRLGGEIITMSMEN